MHSMHIFRYVLKLRTPLPPPCYVFTHIGLSQPSVLDAAAGAPCLRSQSILCFRCCCGSTVFGLSQSCFRCCCGSTVFGLNLNEWRLEL